MNNSSVLYLFYFLSAIFIFMGSLIIFREIVYRFFTKGAPFVITNKSKLKIITDFAKKYNRRYAVDLGSGTGDICFAFSHIGIKSEGIEINPFLVFISLVRKFFLVFLGFFKSRIINSKNTNPAEVNFFVRSFWDVDLSKYDCVVVFGIGYIMKDLENKILNESKKGTVVISHRFRFPNLKSVGSKDRIHVYII